MNLRTANLIFYLVLSTLLSANLIADSKLHLSLAGYWTDRVLFWLWLIFTVVTIVVFWKKRLSKIYLGLLVSGLVLSVLPMMIPFFAVILSVTGQGLRFKQELAQDYRLQIVNYSIMGRPSIEIVKNMGLLEKQIARTNNEIQLDDKTYLEFNEIGNAALISETDTTITFKFSKKDAGTKNEIFSRDITVYKNL